MMRYTLRVVVSIGFSNCHLLNVSHAIEAEANHFEHFCLNVYEHLCLSVYKQIHQQLICLLTIFNSVSKYLKITEGK